MSWSKSISSNFRPVNSARRMPVSSRRRMIPTLGDRLAADAEKVSHLSAGERAALCREEPRLPRNVTEHNVAWRDHRM